MCFCYFKVSRSKLVKRGELAPVSPILILEKLHLVCFSNCFMNDNQHFCPLSFMIFFPSKCHSSLSELKYKSLFYSI